jgi:5-hydroxyisourate hydrolase-like protein (transthyretin family)
VDLSAVEPDGRLRLIRAVTTNAGGRTDAPLLAEGEMAAGRYEISFHAGEYFRSAGVPLADPPYLDVVPVRFAIAEPDGHYHVPLLVSPWSYATSPLLLPALAFGFAALIYVNLLGFRPSMSFLVIGHVVVCVPFVLRTAVAALAQLDPALLDASRSLGANGWFTFRRVTLPLIGRGVGAGAFLAFMASFDNVPVSLFLADERTEVLPIHLWQQIETNLDVRTAAASGLIVVPTLLLMFVAERLAGISKQLR